MVSNKVRAHRHRENVAIYGRFEFYENNFVERVKATSQWHRIVRAIIFVYRILMLFSFPSLPQRQLNQENDSKIQIHWVNERWIVSFRGRSYWLIQSLKFPFPSFQFMINGSNYIYRMRKASKVSYLNVWNRKSISRIELNPLNREQFLSPFP